MNNKAVACNVKVADSIFADGARAYLLNVDSAKQRAKVLARSRGGRMVRRWIKLAALNNFRFVSIQDNPIASDVFAVWDERIVDNLNGQH